MIKASLRLGTVGAILWLAAATAPAAAQTAANGDIILHARRAVNITGAWSLVSDSTAASGYRIANPDLGQPKLAAALPYPSDYFEVTFNPEPGRAYHLWIRSKAENDSWTNDSVYVQFSGSLNSSGAPAYRIGTNSAMMYSLEEAQGAGEQGWGWQDNGYGWNVLGDPISFDGATQTIRIQAREDGLSIDQIVLSPDAYYSSSPGSTKNDTTILPEPGSSSSGPTSSAGAGTLNWTSLVNAVASGSTLRKSGGCSDCGDAGAVSTQSFTAGSVSFSVPYGARMAVGLGTDTSTNTSYTFNYAFSFGGGSSWEIREGGVYRTEGPYSSGDVYKVASDGSSVKYYRNGSLVYTSKAAVPGPLVVDTTLVTIGASLQIAEFTTSGGGTTTAPPSPDPPPPSGGSSLSWTGVVNASASGSSLTKTSGCPDCSDAGAISQQSMSSGSVSFSVNDGTQLVVGLGTDTSANTSYAVNYAFSFSGTNTWEIREAGVYKTEGPFSTSDVFTIASDGSTVRYYRNGTKVYTSKVTVPGSLVVDAALISMGASVQVSAFSASGGSTVTPPPDPTPAPPPAPTPTPEPPSSSGTLRVLQWNTHHGGFGTDGVYDTNRVANWIVAMNPDVVMLNEIEKYTGWGNEDQPEVYKNLLQQKTGKTWYYTFAQEFGQWSANGKGNLILSTYPIGYSTAYELVYNADRSIGMATITVSGTPITLIITHLDPYDATLRLTQATEVTGWAAPQPENRIITGDMNAWPNQTSIAQFNTLYYDSWAVAAANGTATAFAGNNGETKNGRIDYIFYSKGSSNLSVRSSQVYDTRDASGYMPSDHRPVLTTFDIR